VVVVAALILNPIAKRRRLREAEALAAAAAVSDLEAGGPLHQGQIALAEALAAVQSKQHGGTRQTKEIDHDS
jgi:hypothetical protein